MPSASGTAELDMTPTQELEARIAKYDDMIRSENNESNRKFLREKRRAAQAELSRLRENEVADEQSAYAESLDPNAYRTPEQQAAYEASIGIINPDDLQEYSTPYAREIGGNELIDAQSIDPSLYDSAWQDAESNFGDLEYSQDALDRMGEGRDYYGSIFRGNGRDAVSDARYKGRVADAEQVRRAQTDAALAAEEARGGNSAGQRVLAEQAASSGLISDTYRAGLDALALEQDRRDSAAGKYYDLSKGIGDTEFGADYDKAGGLDAFDVSKNQALDYAASQNAGRTQDANVYNANSATGADTYNANKQTGAADTNYQRDVWVSDANVGNANDVLAGNAAARAAGTGAYGSALGMEGGQVLGQGSLDLGRSEFRLAQHNSPTDFERTLGTVTPFVGAAGDVYGQIYKPPTRRGT